jgi:hypothetical protein
MIFFQNLLWILSEPFHAQFKPQIFTLDSINFRFTLSKILNIMSAVEQ